MMYPALSHISHSRISLSCISLSHISLSRMRSLHVSSREPLRKLWMDAARCHTHAPSTSCRCFAWACCAVHKPPCVREQRPLWLLLWHWPGQRLWGRSLVSNVVKPQFVFCFWRNVLDSCMPRSFPKQTLKYREMLCFVKKKMWGQASLESQDSHEACLTCPVFVIAPFLKTWNWQFHFVLPTLGCHA